MIVPSQRYWDERQLRRSRISHELQRSETNLILMKAKHQIGLLVATAALVASLVFSLRSTPRKTAEGPTAPSPSTSRSHPARETIVLVADHDVSLVKRFGRVLRGPELDVGFRTFTSGTEEYNTALHFTFPDELKDKPIQSAVLKLYYRDAWGSFSNRAVTAHRITEHWSEASARFTMGRDASFATNIVGGREARWFSWNATELVRFWTTHPVENFGVLLVSEAPGPNDNSFRFASTRTTNQTFYPALEITYSGSVPR